MMGGLSMVRPIAFPTIHLTDTVPDIKSSSFAGYLGGLRSKNSVSAITYSLFLDHSLSSSSRPAAMFLCRLSKSIFSSSSSSIRTLITLFLTLISYTILNYPTICKKKNQKTQNISISLLTYDYVCCIVVYVKLFGRAKCLRQEKITPTGTGERRGIPITVL